MRTISAVAWKSQPKGLVALNENFGCVSVFTPFNQAGYTQSGSPVDVVTYVGRAKYFSASQASLYRTAKDQEKTNGASILWVGTLHGTPTTAACLGGTTYDSANGAPYVGIALKRRSVASDNIFVTHNNTATFNNLASAGTSYTSGAYIIIGTAESGAQKLYIRAYPYGAMEELSATVSGSIAYTTTSRLEIGDSLNARDPAASCALLAMFGKALSKPEAYALLENPWQVFQPLSAKVYSFPAAAAGGSTVPVLYRQRQMQGMAS